MCLLNPKVLAYYLKTNTRLIFKDQFNEKNNYGFEIKKKKFNENFFLFITRQKNPRWVSFSSFSPYCVNPLWNKRTLHMICRVVRRSFCLCTQLPHKSASNIRHMESQNFTLLFSRIPFSEISQTLRDFLEYPNRSNTVCTNLKAQIILAPYVPPNKHRTRRSRKN